MHNVEIEKWVDIKGFETLFQVSNLGRVKSLARIVKRDNGNSTHRKVPEKIRKISVKPNGYPVITLTKFGKRFGFRVSRLVAIMWVANPYNLPEVNHEDGNKLNCRADNLTWTDRSGNMKHAYKTGLRKKPAGFTHAMRSRQKSPSEI